MMLTHPTLCRGSPKQRTATPYVWEQGPGLAQPQAGGVAALCFATADGVDDRIGARGCPGCLIKPPTSESLTGLRAAQNSEQQ